GAPRPGGQAQPTGSRVPPTVRRFQQMRTPRSRRCRKSIHARDPNEREGLDRRVEWVEVAGKTIAEATEMALDQLGVAEGDAEVIVVTEPKVGLFGRMRVEAR